MHVAFALMIAVPAIFLVRNRVLKVLWAIYPAIVTFVVVVTANHFWIDAALGAARRGRLGLGGLLRLRACPARGLGAGAPAPRSRRERRRSTSARGARAATDAAAR